MIPEKLTKLLALANRPGTEAEGVQALAMAERIAGEHELRITRDVNGEWVVFDRERAELLEALQQIANGTYRPPGGGAFVVVHMTTTTMSMQDFIHVWMGPPTAPPNG